MPLCECYLKLSACSSVGDEIIAFQLLQSYLTSVATSAIAKPLKLRYEQINN